MKLKEAREIILGCDLSEGALKRANEILATAGSDEEIEISEEIIDQLMAILDVDIDSDKLKLEACDDAIDSLSGFIGEIGAASKLAGDDVEETAKNVYNDASKLFNDETDDNK
ncbi:MAG: hypothetical protein WC503_05785 [Candidatus Shapirobacteria bacterium]